MRGFVQDGDTEARTEGRKPSQRRARDLVFRKEEVFTASENSLLSALTLQVKTNHSLLSSLFSLFPSFKPSLSLFHDSYLFTSFSFSFLFLRVITLHLSPLSPLPSPSSPSITAKIGEKDRSALGSEQEKIEVCIFLPNRASLDIETSAKSTVDEVTRFSRLPHYLTPSPSLPLSTALHLHYFLSSLVICIRLFARRFECTKVTLIAITHRVLSIHLIRIHFALRSLSLSLSLSLRLCACVLVAEEEVSPPLLYTQPELYELRTHEEDGFPGDFTLDRGKLVKGKCSSCGASPLLHISLV